MKIIDLETLDIKGAYLLNKDSSFESNIFLHENTLFKIFKQDHVKNITNKEKKIQALYELHPAKFLTLPTALLYYQEKFIGYTMDYIESKSLSNYLFCKKKIKLSLLYELKKTIDAIHKLGIIIGDLNLYNVLVTKEGKIVICDTDNFSIQGYPNDIFRDFQQVYLLNHEIDFSLDHYCFNIESIALLTKTIDNMVLSEMRKGLFEKKLPSEVYFEFIKELKISSNSPYLIDHLKTYRIEKLLPIIKK